MIERSICYFKTRGERRVYEETLTGRPHDTSVQKATSDNENVDAV